MADDDGLIVLDCIAMIISDYVSDDRLTCHGIAAMGGVINRQGPRRLSGMSLSYGGVLLMNPMVLLTSLRQRMIHMNGCHWMVIALCYGACIARRDNNLEGYRKQQGPFIMWHLSPLVSTLLSWLADDSTVNP